MKLIIFGHKDRAARCMKYLFSQGVEIACLVSPSNVSPKDKSIQLAKENKIANIMWSNNPEQVRAQLEEFDYELFVVCGFPHIFEADLINSPRLGTINLHAGKLPEYRGSSPINWALINGEREITISIIKMTEEIDAGPIIKELTLRIEKQDNAASVLNWALNQFPKLLHQAIVKIKQDNQIIGKEQNTANARYFPLRTPEDGFINFESMKVDRVLNLIRALCSPFPGAFSIIDGRKVYFTEAEKIGIRFIGVPGKVYLVRGLGLIVMAKDCGMRIVSARFDDQEKGALIESKELSGKRFKPYLKV